MGPLVFIEDEVIGVDLFMGMDMDMDVVEWPTSYFFLLSWFLMMVYRDSIPDGSKRPLAPSPGLINKDTHPYGSSMRHRHRSGCKGNAEINEPHDIYR